MFYANKVNNEKYHVKYNVMIIGQVDKTQMTDDGKVVRLGVGEGIYKSTNEINIYC